MGFMTLTPGFKCEVGDILEVNWGNHAQRVKVIEIVSKDGGMAFYWTEIRPLTRRERRGKDKPDEKYYLNYAKNRSYL